MSTSCCSLPVVSFYAEGEGSIDVPIAIGRRRLVIWRRELESHSRTWLLFVVIKFMKTDPRLARQVDHRHDKKCERDYEQNRDSIFMLQSEKGSRERHDNQERSNNRTYRREEDRVAQEHGASFESGNVRLQPRSRPIVVLDRIQCLRSIEDTIQTRHQNRNKTCNSAQKECGSRDTGSDLSQLLYRRRF